MSSSTNRTDRRRRDDDDRSGVDSTDERTERTDWQWVEVDEESQPLVQQVEQPSTDTEIVVMYADADRQARIDDLEQTVADLERRLRDRKARIEAQDRARQMVIERYESILADRNRWAEEDRDRLTDDSGFFGRLADRLFPRP